MKLLYGTTNTAKLDLMEKAEDKLAVAQGLNAFFSEVLSAVCGEHK